MPTLRAVLVLVFAIAFAASPFLSPGFDGFDPNRYPVPQLNPPAQPMGYAFAIWGPIYLALIVHGIWGVMKRREDAASDATRLPLIASLAVGAVWLPAAQVAPIGATVMIFVMLGGALLALSRSMVLTETWQVSVPLGLYAGWLTAASFVSIALLGAGYGIVFGETGWAIISLSLTVIVASIFILRTGWVLYYAVALIWALIAIIAANIGANLPVALFAAAGMVAIIAVLLTWRLPRG